VKAAHQSFQRTRSSEGPEMMFAEPAHGQRSGNRRTWPVRFPGLLVLPLLGGIACAQVTDPSVPAGRSGADQGAGGGVSQSDDDLLVRVDRGDGSPVEEWTLSCLGVVAGSHPEAGPACAHLARLDDPFAPLPGDIVCTEQYGGPQTAHVTGRWNGEPVDLELSRTDGCRIAQWDSLGPLLPVPAGDLPPG
jgi:hypothetical protein